MSSSPAEEDIGKLVEMGYEREIAIRARHLTPHKAQTGTDVPPRSAGTSTGSGLGAPLSAFLAAICTHAAGAPADR